MVTHPDPGKDSGRPTWCPLTCGDTTEFRVGDQTWEVTDSTRTRHSPCCPVASSMKVRRSHVAPFCIAQSWGDPETPTPVPLPG